MKQIIIALLLLSTFAMAQASPKTEADQLYEQEKYEEAAAAYQQIIDN